MYYLRASPYHPVIAACLNELDFAALNSVQGPGVELEVRQFAEQLGLASSLLRCAIVQPRVCVVRKI